MTTLALLVFLLPPVPAAPSPSVDELLERVESLEKQRADIEKQKQEALEQLRARLKEIQSRLDRLNVPTPKPPEPKPPEPPKPPAPVDPLAAKLKAAFDADAAPADKKREQAKDLAELYRQAGKLAADPAVGTSGELLQRVQDAAKGLVGADALKGCRRAVAGELGALLPTDDALSDDQRRQVAALFGKLAAFLDSLGG